MNLRLGLVVTAIALLGAQNVAPVSAPPPPSSDPRHSQTVDVAFASALVQGGDAEIRAAKLALMRTRSDDVAAFARQMITDHDAIAAEGAPLVKKYRAGTIDAVGPADRLGLFRLQTLAPVDFDRQYALLQIGDHLATQTAFATEAQSGADPLLAAFARKWLPTIEAHLELAVTLVKHVGGDTPFR